MIREGTLVDGTACIVDTTAATEVAAVGVWYDRGSRDEAEKEKGSTHFIEHMLFKGTSTRSAFDIAREIDALGGSINAVTERESVSFFAAIPADGFEKTADILTDMTVASSFDRDEFERERSVIRNELSAAEDDPEETAADAFSELLFAKHPLGRKIGGSIVDVDALTRDDAVLSYDRHYRGKAALVTVAGDIEYERVEKAFGAAFSSVESSPRRTAPAWPLKFGAFYKNAPFQHAQFFCSFQTEGALAPNAYHALQVANSVMGDSMSSRLFQSLRERLGLCYSVYTAPSLFSDCTLWTVFASSNVETLPSLVEALSEELRRFSTEGGFSERETSDAKAQILGGMKLSSMDIEYRMRRLAKQRLYGAETLSLAETGKRISAVDRGSANDSLNRFIVASRPLVFAYGPAGGRSRFLAAAEKLVDTLGNAR